MSQQLALHLLITLPFAAGVLALIIPRRLAPVTRILTVAVSALVLVAAAGLFRAAGGGEAVTLFRAPAWAGGVWAGKPMLALDGLSALILLGLGFFSLVVAIYSVGFLRDAEVSPAAYYSSFLWVVGSASATVLSRDLLVLTFFWALMGIPFYLLINLGSGKADAAAKKTLIILGGTDSLMILGVGLIYRISGSFDLLQPSLSVAGIGGVACVCLAAAAFAKAGAMPLHSWVPETAETAPVPVVAFLPASLDKLLGIYLFTRISLGLFQISPFLRGVFMVIGAVTIMAAVMAALVQHNLRRLLGFHAVSQVGYMVLGIATGTAIGVIGGLFHMVNNALYKCCLFLTAGAAERRSGESELDQMGALAHSVPLTFLFAVIAAMAISGVPPLNGFASKWMIYQGIINVGRESGFLWVFALVAAMLGSALTLASFVKVLHSVFLGQPRRGPEADGPLPNIAMKLSMGVLAMICVLFGVFAYSVPVRRLLLPALPEQFRVTFTDASWQPGMATLLLCVALVVGVVVYIVGAVGNLREDEAYIGGEIGEKAKPFRFSGVEFYRTVAELPSLKTLYRHAEEGWYDPYELVRRTAFYFAGMLRALHSGLLPRYVAWCVLGLVILMWIFLT